MRQPKRQSGFVLSVLLTLLFNLEWTIPAWIFLALHFIFDLSLWYFYPYSLGGYKKGGSYNEEN